MAGFSMGLMIKSRQIAGAKITSQFLSASADDLVIDIKNKIVAKASELEVLDYIYVVDKQERLIGVTSYKKLLQSEDESRIAAIMKTHPVTIDFHTDQERLVYLVLRHDLKAIPVVDNQHRLKGIVPYHAILKVFQHEFREDILRSGGIHHDLKEIEEISTPVAKLVRARLPSLGIGLLGGLFAAYMVTGFEQILSSFIALAAFIPVMVYLSDAVGTQSQTLIVRMIALDPDFSVRRYITRELKIGSTIGAVFASLLLVAGTVGWGLHIGVVTASAIFISIIFQAFMATYLSVTLARRHIDPALASGPLTTIISDITSLAMYFTIASLLLTYVQ